MTNRRRGQVQARPEGFAGANRSRTDGRRTHERQADKPFTLDAVLNRYTSLPFLLDILSKHRITLLSPEAWEDRNDAYYLERYRDEKQLRTILALCFSMRPETFHQWRVFSHGSSGVCIEFDRNRLLRSVRGMDGFRSEQVTYLPIKRVQRQKPDMKTWPFLKRMPYKDEAEFRILFESRTESVRSKCVDIDLSAVRKVTLSPWLPDSVVETVRDIIRGMDGCSRLSINRSSLVDNAGWRKAID